MFRAKLMKVDSMICLINAVNHVCKVTTAADETSEQHAVHSRSLAQLILSTTRHPNLVMGKDCAM